MINAQETKRLLRKFALECYEFWANELCTDKDERVWPKVFMDLECVTRDPFSPNGDLLDVESKEEFIQNLKLDLRIQ